MRRSVGHSFSACALLLFWVLPVALRGPVSAAAVDDTPERFTGGVGDGAGPFAGADVAGTSGPGCRIPPVSSAGAGDPTPDNGV